ncbi:MAG: hypothetical protein QME25_06930 [Bacteroidota bacterium]|nr:hypothetical protein [Bacteroidota bacterium]
MFSKSQITKDEIYQRIKNKFLGELYIKSIMLAMYTIDKHNQLQEISELSKSVDRIFKLSKKQKKS